MPDDVLAVEGLVAGYGEGVVLHDLSFSLAGGGSLAVLGRNGVGKTTTLLTILGHVQARAGRVVLHGVDITRWEPHRRIAAGLGWVPQGREMFPSLTVDEHLTIARRPGAWNRKRVYDLFPRLEERRRNLGNQLSGGEQQMLAIGRALMTNPRVMLMDEPLEGLAPVIVEEVSRCIARLLAEEAMSIVLVEQHAKFALDLTGHAIVLERGRIVESAPSDALLADEGRLEAAIGMSRLHDAS